MTIDEAIIPDTIPLMQAALIANDIFDADISALDAVKSKYSTKATDIAQLYQILCSEAALSYDYQQKGKASLIDSTIEFAYFGHDMDGCFKPENSTVQRQSLINYLRKRERYVQAFRLMLKHEKPKPTNQFKETVTAEQGALLAFGFKDYGNIEALIVAMELKQINKLDIDSIEMVKELKEALQEQLELHKENEIYESTCYEMASIGEPYHAIGPSSPTIRPASPKYKGEYNNELDLDNSEIAKLALTVWLWEGGHQDLASNVTPEYDKTKYDKHIAEQEEKRLLQWSPQMTQQKAQQLDHAPSMLKFAYELHQDVWSNLPKNMRSPLKPELTDYIRKKLQASAAPNNQLIEAIIRLSTPDDHSFGGKQDPTKVKWQPKEKR